MILLMFLCFDMAMEWRIIKHYSLIPATMNYTDDSFVPFFIVFIAIIVLLSPFFRKDIFCDCFFLFYCGF